jgi:hypothetical protein
MLVNVGKAHEWLHVKDAAAIAPLVYGVGRCVRLIAQLSNMVRVTAVLWAGG